MACSGPEHGSVDTAGKEEERRAGQIGLRDPGVSSKKLFDLHFSGVN